MSRSNYHVSKGDIVEVISGNHRGSQGKVLQVIARKDQVLIEGVRLVKKHLRKSQDNPNGAIAEREGPIHVSNVRLVERGEKAQDEKTAKGRKPAKKEKGDAAG